MVRFSQYDNRMSTKQHDADERPAKEDKDERITDFLPLFGPAKWDGSQWVAKRPQQQPDPNEEK